MSVLVDSSVWIEYFRNSKYPTELDFLISENLIVTNDLILAELIPYMHIQKQTRLINLMQEIDRVPLNINWPDIITMQVACIKNGINGVGIPDLIIVQHAIQNNYVLLAEDRHFKLISRYVPLILYSED